MHDPLLPPSPPTWTNRPESTVGYTSGRGQGANSYQRNENSSRIRLRGQTFNSSSINSFYLSERRRGGVLVLEIECFSEEGLINIKYDDIGAKPQVKLKLFTVLFKNLWNFGKINEIWGKELSINILGYFSSMILILIL